MIFVWDTPEMFENLIGGEMNPSSEQPVHNAGHHKWHIVIPEKYGENSVKNISQRKLPNLSLFFSTR